MSANQSHYEINVSKAVKNINGTWIESFGRIQYKHLFATAPRSCVDSGSAKKVLDEIKLKFPAPEYSVMMSHYDIVGIGVDIRNF